MPEWLRYLLVENIKRIYGKNRGMFTREVFSIEDFFVVSETTESIDLLAVCRK
jgi:hypothetical protein